MTSTTAPASTTKAALTTIFTPPSSCLQRTYTLGQSGTHSDFTDRGSDGSTLTIYRGYSTECFPPEATLSDGWVQFSPGLCPSAYSIASMWSDGIGMTETFATCCPWYMSASTGYYDCGSFPQSTNVVLSAAGLGSSAVITSAGYAFDTPIFIAWQSTDLSRLEHHPTETGSWNVATDIQAPLMMANASQSTSASVATTPAIIPVEKDGGSLSTGAKAGIGIGVSLGVLLLLLGIVAFTLWRRRKAKKHNFTSMPSQQRNEFSEDGSIHHIGDGGEVFEAGGEESKHHHEWRNKAFPAEVEGNTGRVVELDAQAGAEREQKGVWARTGTVELEGDAPSYRGNGGGGGGSRY